jgi:hypothetical protein
MCVTFKSGKRQMFVNVEREKTRCDLQVLKFLSYLFQPNRSTVRLREEQLIRKAYVYVLRIRSHPDLG